MSRKAPGKQERKRARPSHDPDVMISMHREWDKNRFVGNEDVVARVRRERRAATRAKAVLIEENLQEYTRNTAAALSSLYAEYPGDGPIPEAAMRDVSYWGRGLYFELGRAYPKIDESHRHFLDYPTELAEKAWDVLDRIIVAPRTHRTARQRRPLN